MGYILPIDNIVARNDVHQANNNAKKLFKIQKVNKIKLENNHMDIDKEQNKDKYKFLSNRYFIHDGERAFLTGKGLLFNQHV